MKPALLALLTLALATPAHATDSDAEIIRAEILAGAKACTEGRAADVMKSYARDMQLQYPGTPDNSYESLTKAYPRLCGTGEGTVESTVPQFEEIYVSGPMAVARMIWTTRLRGMPPGASRQLRDFQVWEKRNGEWTFIRGVHYPYKPVQ